MKLLVLCNDRMALPALARLLQMGLVAGVGMRSKTTEVHSVVNMLCSQYNVPFKLFTKTGFAASLQHWVEETAPDAVLVKTFPWKIPAEALAVPKYGFINFHYAPLPAYKGANPLFWMIKDGVPKGGVTVHQMTDRMDEGPILLSSTIDLPQGTTFGMLCSQLGYSGAELTDKLLAAMKSGELTGTMQDASGGEWYRQPRPDDLLIKWDSMDAAAVMRLVNACNPWNKAAPAKINGWTMGITHVTPFQQVSDAGVQPGTIIAAGAEHGFCIACAGHTAIQVNIIYTEEGFLPGLSLVNFGLGVGMKFD